MDRRSSRRLTGTSDAYEYMLHISPAAVQFPEEARAVVEHQLRLLAACANGISPSQDAFQFDDETDTPESEQRIRDMTAARSDPSLVEVRDAVVALLRETMSYWSTNPELSDVRQRIVTDFHSTSSLTAACRP